MKQDPIPELLRALDPELIRRRLFYLAQDPLPFRKLNYTLPGHEKNTLYEADDYIQSQLESWGYEVEKEGVPVQAYRRDENKPRSAQYSPPAPEDPWYTAYNLYAKKPGEVLPEEIIILISHKDSQSWIDSPGAYDNAVGTAANLEIARLLADYSTRRSLWFVYCNEEHTPWTSVTAANNARDRGDNIVAVFNLDSPGGRSQADLDAGRRTNVTMYTAPEGERLADLVTEVNDTYDIGLIQSKFLQPRPGNDDGSYIKAGFPAAIINLGSNPYADPEYHTEGDVPERVDLVNALMTTKATLAAMLRVDREA